MAYPARAHRWAVIAPLVAVALIGLGPVLAIGGSAPVASRPVAPTATAQTLAPRSTLPVTHVISRPLNRAPGVTGAPPHGVPWTNLSTANQPSERGGPAIASDPANNLTLLFGGENVTPTGLATCLNDTWEFFNGKWTNLSLSYAPPVTCTGAMVWDARDGYFLLFGGNPGLGNAAYNQTWAFASGKWHNLTTSVAPPQVFAPGLVYDGLDQYVVEFGGIRGGFGSFNTTWTYTAGNWTNITSSAGTAPSDRGFVGMTYDPTRKSVYLFGGRWYPYGVDFNDTWAFSAGKWHEVLNGSGYGPNVRRGVGFAYDPRYGYDLLVGGESQTPVGTDVELNDTWFFNGTAWTNTSAYETTSGPTGGFSAGFVFVSNETGDLEFGGCTAYGCTVVQNDTWTYTWNLTASLTAEPTILTNNSNLRLVGNASGGTFSFGFAYTSLPPGCTSANVSELTCRPDRVGNYTPRLTASSYGFVFSNVTVTGPTIHVVVPLANQPLVARPALDLRQTEWINSSANGGLPGYTYAYANLPQGCTSANVTDLACTPTVPGGYTVKVTVTDAGKETNVSYGSFVVHPALAVVLLASTARADAGVNVTFGAIPSGGDGSYVFSWPGLPSACKLPTGPTVTCEASASGYLNVTVALEDTLNGTPAQGNASVFVTPNPSATVDVAPTHGTEPLTIEFTAQLAGGVSPYTTQWVFGDGSTADFANASHTYYAGGTFTATFWYNDSDHIGGHTSVVVDVTARPAVALTSSGWSAEVGQTVTLNATASGGETPYTYAWQGLPTGCAASNVSLLACAPTAAGVFALTVTVTDADRVVFSNSHSIAVASRLAATANGSQVSGCGFPENVSYVVAASGGLAPYHYAWLFPDGSTADSAATSRVYSATPSGLATVTVTDSLGIAVVRNVSAPTATACFPSAPSGGGGGGGTPTWEWVAVGAAVALVVVGVFLGRRRGRSPSPAEPEVEFQQPEALEFEPPP